MELRPESQMEPEPLGKIIYKKLLEIRINLKLIQTIFLLVHFKPIGPLLLCNKTVLLIWGDNVYLTDSSGIFEFDRNLGFKISAWAFLTLNS